MTLGKHTIFTTMGRKGIETVYRPTTWWTGTNIRKRTR